MKRAIAALSITAAFTAGPAWAQPSMPPSISPPQTGDERTARTSQARTEADALIAQARAGDLFDNVTHDIAPRVRHRRSGMVCTFTLGEQSNRLMIFDSGIPRGDDVGCNTTSGGVFQTHYATRYRPTKSASDGLAEAAAAIRKRYPDAREFDGVLETWVERPGQPPFPRTLLAHFVIDVDGRDTYTAARVAEYEGWTFKQRASVVFDKLSEGQIVAEWEWQVMLKEVVDWSQAI